MKNIAYSLAFASAMIAGAYCICHDHATIGGWICIISLLSVSDFGFNRRDS